MSVQSPISWPPADRSSRPYSDPDRWEEIVIPPAPVLSNEEMLRSAVDKIASGKYLIAPFNRLSLLSVEGAEVVQDPAANPYASFTPEFFYNNVLVAKAAFNSPNQTKYLIATKFGPLSSPRGQKLTETIKGLVDHRNLLSDLNLWNSQTRIVSIERA